MIRLYINEVEVDVSEDEDFPITYQQSDAKEPNKTKRSASKTLKLPGTRVNNNFFMSAYRLALSDIYGDSIGFEFNPNERYPVLVTRRGKPIFIGAGNLRKVIKRNGIVQHYEFVIYSDIVDLIQGLGDVLVSELGWSDYDHTLSVANIQASWSAATGSGYVYPYIYYGFDQDPQVIKTNELYPWVYEKEVIEKCLGFLGYTLNSSFFDTTTQKKVIWGWGGGDPIGISSADAANRHVEYTGDGASGAAWSITTQGATFGVFGNFVTKFYTTAVALINDSSIMTMTQVDDPASQYTKEFGELIIANTGDYKMQVSGTFPITYTFSGSPRTNEQYNFEFKCRIFKNFAQVAEQVINISDTAAGSDTLTVDLEVDVHCDTGDIITADFYISTFGTQFEELALDTLTVDIDFNNTILFELDALDTTIVDGDTVNIARFLPVQKAADFFKDVIMQYNLYVSDPDENGEVTMLPLDQYFYDTDDVDVWTDKIDNSSDIEIEPASKIQGKVYSFRWAEDLDYYKKLFWDLYGVQTGVHYGDYNYSVPSTFKKGEKVYQLKSAMSVPVQIEGTDIIVPFIIKRNETTGLVSPHKGKPRKLFYNGLVSTTDGWTLVNSNTGATTAVSQVPQAHHLDSLTSPTKDLCWLNPIKVFYDASAYTSNGLFNAHHERFIREITSKDSKIVNAWFRLTEDDFYENFMRRLVNIDGVQYRKNVVKDWIANKNNLIKVELIKILEGRSRGYYQTAKEEAVEPAISYGGDPDTPITSDTTAKSNQRFYQVDTSTRTVTVTLPADDLRSGWTGSFIKTDPSNDLILTPSGGGASGSYINGATSLTIKSQYDAPTVYFDGQNFWVI